MKEKNKTSEILKLAVKRMLPGGPLAKKQLTKLKIYNGENHPHEIKNPKDKWDNILEKFVSVFFKKSNKDEIIKNNDEIIIKFEITL